MSTPLHAATYVGDLGNGLIRRWSTAADQPKIAACMGGVFRDRADEAPNRRAMDVARVLMQGDFPFMGPDDFAVVIDANQPEQPVVAYTCLWRLRWNYAGIPFSVGQPEMVATNAEYRNRGLVRALFEMIHARSAAEGHLVQAITGIPYFYRQFGYEFVLDLDGNLTVPLTAAPLQPDDAAEAYTLRLATLDDVPQVMALYALPSSQSLVWHEAPAAFWRHFIASWDDPFVQQHGPLGTILSMRLHMILDGSGNPVGYVALAAKRWDEKLEVGALQLAADVNWQAAMPSLLRAFCRHARQLPPIESNDKAFEAIKFNFGRSHPLYAVLGDGVAKRYEPPYAWYLRVADAPAFLRHIAPVLEARLARSLLTGYTGELKIDFYNGGLRLQFDQGTLAAVEPWRAPAYGDEADAGCPPLVFLQLLFGYRSLAELRAFFPDVWAKPEAALFIDALFPKRPSTVHPLSNV
jgi:hypothetical protein